MKGSVWTLHVLCAHLHAYSFQRHFRVTIGFADWLKESDDDFKAWKEEKNAKRAEEEAAIEAKMQMWLKAAEEKKRAEGSM